MGSEGKHEPVTIERLEQCLLLAAYFIELDGPVMVPIFERLERELEAAKRTEATSDRARKLLEANRHRLDDILRKPTQ
ncbi:hypothetical protein SAMN05444321_6141 [Bradyrhizobium lablabi]|nr:hypothetical protein SAMN05444321_6141 [Bradyrhizobium lablabi]